MYDYYLWLLTLGAVAAAICYVALQQKKRISPLVTDPTDGAPTSSKNKSIWTAFVKQFESQPTPQIKQLLDKLEVHIPDIPDNILQKLISIAIKRDMIDTLHRLVEGNKSKIPALFTQASWGSELARFQGEPTRRNEMAHLFLEALVEPEELKKHGFVVACFSVPGSNVHVWAVDQGQIQTADKASTSFLGTDKLEYTAGYEAYKVNGKSKGLISPVPDARRWGFEDAAQNRPQKFTEI